MDTHQKNYAEEREQARACSCPSCRAKYNLPPKDNHDPHIRPIQQLTDHSRANVLLRQQQLRQRDGWHFEAMSIAEYNQIDIDPLWMDAVYDYEQGGVWWRKKSAVAKPERRTSLAQKSNRYDRPMTRFGDLMSGLSRIAKGLQEIDHATDGDLGESIFDLLR